MNWNFVDGKKLVLIKEYAVDDPAKAAWLQVLIAFPSCVVFTCSRRGRKAGERRVQLVFAGIG